MSLKLRIMLRAVQIRLERGEVLEEVLSGWPALTEEERAALRAAAAPDAAGGRGRMELLAQPSEF